MEMTSAESGIVGPRAKAHAMGPVVVACLVRRRRRRSRRGRGFSSRRRRRRRKEGRATVTSTRDTMNAHVKGTTC